MISSVGENVAELIHGFESRWSHHFDFVDVSRLRALERLGSVASVAWDESLHLATSMRSFRSEKVSAFVKAVLDSDKAAARTLLREVAPRYPMAVTRDLGRARAWIRAHARGSERYGLVASSQAQRLKPHAIDVRVNVDPVQWFLNDRHDTRSSYYLEDAATEFQVQGLELDWVCVTWGRRPPAPRRLVALSVVPRRCVDDHSQGRQEALPAERVSCPADPRSTGNDRLRPAW